MKGAPHHQQDRPPLWRDCPLCGVEYDDSPVLNPGICDDCSDRLDWHGLHEALTAIRAGRPPPDFTIHPARETPP